MPQQFIDENISVAVMGFGSAGSLEFGSATPSTSSCKCTMDGNPVNSGGTLGPGTAGPGGNSRATGSAAVTAFNDFEVTTGKPDALVVATFDHSQYDGMGISLNQHNGVRFTNYTASTITFHYSYL